MSVVVKDFHKSYGLTNAVQGLSFRVEPGQVLGLLGPNGAGKTTTLRALAGILQPSQGQLFVANHDVERDPVTAKSVLAYVPDDPALFDNLTVWEHLRFAAAAYRLDPNEWPTRGETLLKEFELVEKREALASELSRGMRQKVAICCGFLHKPLVILLDEPMTGLDPKGIRTMKNSLHQRAAEGATVIVSSHLLSLVGDICTDILIVHHGRRLLQGSLRALSEEMRQSGSSETLEDLFLRLTATHEGETSGGDLDGAFGETITGDPPPDGQSSRP